MSDLEKNVGALANAVLTMSETAKAVELRMHGMQTVLMGMLRVVAQRPDLAPVLGREITLAAEAMHGVSLGYPVTEDFLQQRDDVLQQMLPTGLKEHVHSPLRP